MKIKLENNGFLEHGELFKDRVLERIPVEFTDGGMTVEIKLDKRISVPESFSICADGDKWSITGSDELGLYFGIGKFLHTAIWSDSDFTPKATSGVVSADCHFRAMYFANHFYNFYRHLFIYLF